MKRVVAIKMLPPAVTKDAAAAARFQREVEAAAKLSHPNIVAAYDADEANGAHFLVMEYVEGKDLSAIVKKDGPFPVAKAVDYILQAAQGPGVCSLRRALSIATSSPPTCCWTRKVRSRSSIWAWPASRPAGRCQARPGAELTAQRQRHGHRRLHGSGTGHGQPAGRCSFGYLQPGLHASLPAHRPATLWRRLRVKTIDGASTGSDSAALLDSAGHSAGL